MLRLQTAKLPATVLAFCQDYVIKLCDKHKSLFPTQQQSCFVGLS